MNKKNNIESIKRIMTERNQVWKKVTVEIEKGNNLLPNIPKRQCH